MSRLGKYVALDLGTTYTRIWTQERGILLRCPTAAAIQVNTHEVVALGSEARRMLGRTPEDIKAYRPIKDGAVADFDVCSRMVGTWFIRHGLKTTFHRPVVMLSTPYRMTEVERYAAENAVFEAGARSVAQVPAIFAAAVGAGLRTSSPHGGMILSMGGGLTEAAVISSGGIVSAKSMKVAGERLDYAIINYLKNQKQIKVGDMTAEALKIRVAKAVQDPAYDRGEMEVCGLNTLTGAAAKCRVSSAEICEAIRPTLDAVARLTLSVLEEIAPELSADVNRFGVMLCGGGALIPGIDRALSERCGLRVTLARQPLDCVITGLSRIVLNPELWGEKLMSRLR